MDWEYKLKELSNYNIAFEIRQGYYHISIVYQNGWDIIVPENDYIYLEKRGDTYHYIASTDSVNINDMFKAIEHTINYNKDLEKKLELFKEKTSELQELFSKETYEKLKTLEFVFPMQKKKTKKVKKKEDTKIETIEVSDNNSVSVIEDNNPTVTIATTDDNYDTDEEVVVTMKEGEFIEELKK